MSTTQLINPATEEVLASVDHTDANAVDDAVQRARAAQRRWARLAPAQRAAGLRAFAAAVQAHLDELAALEVANSGHPIVSAEWEAGHVRDVLAFYAASPERLSGRQIPVAGGVDVTFNEPMGVVGVDHAMEFPDGDRVLGHRAGAGRRQRGAGQTRRTDAADHDAAR